MLSGSSPFKDASEWLIFQRIIARDLRFPEYFSDEARDLIDKLLVSTKCFHSMANLPTFFLSHIHMCIYNFPLSLMNYLLSQ